MSDQLGVSPTIVRMATRIGELEAQRDAIVTELESIERIAMNDPLCKHSRATILLAARAALAECPRRPDVDSA